MDTKDIFKPILAKMTKRHIGLLVFFCSDFLAITALAKVKVDIDLGFDPHLFAKFNAGINFTVAVLLPAGIYFAKIKNMFFINE